LDQSSFRGSITGNIDHIFFFVDGDLRAT